MILPILLLIFFLGWLLKVLIFERPEPQPKISSTFTVAVRYGELQIVVHHESSPDPFQPRAERIIRLWAIGREERQATAEFQLDLEDELQGKFPDLGLIVVSAVITGAPPEKIKPMTYTERLVGDLKEKKLAAESIAEEAGLDVSDIAGASLEVHQKRYAKERVKAIYHHPDHA